MDTWSVLAGIGLGAIVGATLRRRPTRWATLLALMTLGGVAAAARWSPAGPLHSGSLALVATATSVAVIDILTSAARGAGSTRARDLGTETAEIMRGPVLVRLFGGVVIYVNGRRWSTSRPLAELLLSDSGLAVALRFRFLNWSASGLSLIPIVKDDGQRLVWFAPWSEVSAVRLRGGEIGIRAGERGSCLFIAPNAESMKAAATFLEKSPVEYESARPTLKFIRASDK